MGEKEKYYPEEKNFGKECKFWTNEEGCTFPKGELEGRRSCEGLIDDVCLYVIYRRDYPGSQNLEQRQWLKLRRPGPKTNPHIPPGDIEK